MLACFLACPPNCPGNLEEPRPAQPRRNLFVSLSPQLFPSACTVHARPNQPITLLLSLAPVLASGWLAGWAGWAGWAADVADKVRSYSTSDFFGEIALISDDNTRTATVKVASGSATYLRLARPDIDDDLLHLIRTAATLDLGDLRFAGDMEAQLEESREECASKYSECTLCDAAAAAAAAAAA